MNMRISDPYVVYINNTDKTYVLRNRCYLPLGESDDRQFVRFKYDETIYLYNDGSKPWESKTHKKVYTKKYEDTMDRLLDFKKEN